MISDLNPPVNVVRTQYYLKSRASGSPFLRLLLAVLFCSVLFFASGSNAADETPLEYKIKAAFTFNFIKFIDWPKGSVSKEDSILTIFILGNGPINGALLDFDGRKVSGWTLRIQKVDDIRKVRQPGILFINLSEEDELLRIVEQTRRKGILTISEMEKFCERGGILNFVIQDDSVNFEINLKEAKLSRLSISYKLLNQAIKIHE